MKKFFIFFTLLIIFLPINKILANESSSGFVNTNIWYSQENFEEGDNIKIYTLIFNSEDKDLSGSISFFDKEILLGKKNFSIPPKSARDVSIDWLVTTGDHSIFAKIESSKILISKNKYEDVFLKDNQSEKNKVSINKKIKIDSEKTTEIPKNISSIENIRNLVVDKTPDFISIPIIKTLSGLEEFREKSKDFSIENKNEAKNQIELLNKNNDLSKNDNFAEKPLKYIKLFFFELFYLIFSNKMLFYVAFIGIMFYLIRIIWRKFT